MEFNNAVTFYHSRIVYQWDNQSVSLLLTNNSKLLPQLSTIIQPQEGTPSIKYNQQDTPFTAIPLSLDL